MFDVDTRIHEVTQKRQDAWSHGGDPAEVSRLSQELDFLYEERRIQRASIHGSRSEIVRRARIEVELERMMSTP